MSGGPIRVSHLVSPFGPGSIYTDKDGIPYIIGGLDHWFPSTLALSDDYSFDDFAIEEPRLSSLLGVEMFRRPPDYRRVAFGGSRPVNAQLTVPVFRFPRWYRNTKRNGALKQFNLTTARIPSNKEEGHWTPVRFIAICAHGHISDFPWKEWSGCTCATNDGLQLTDGGGDDLTSVVAGCTQCDKRRTLSGTTSRPSDESEQSSFQKAGIGCPGGRPWLGDDADVHCTEALVGALVNQSNVYFGNVLSSLWLPQAPKGRSDLQLLCSAIQDPTMGCSGAHLLWRLGNKKAAVAVVSAALAERGQTAPADLLAEALDLAFSGRPAAVPGAAQPAHVESSLAQARREEFNILRDSFADRGAPHLHVVQSSVAPTLRSYISRVTLVEKLRETRAFYGFSRLLNTRGDIRAMPEAAMSQLFLRPPALGERWLPAIEVHGEGIYVELSEAALLEWQRTQATHLRARISEEFLHRMDGIQELLPPSTPNDIQWASRYLLVHSLAHIVINQLVFECGYSTASLRERLFVSADQDAPMAGFLIYTAAGDADGTLGGLVRQGAPDLLASTIRRALLKASWCSADPVCSESLGGRGAKRANLAGCHACLLLPETSCETINHGLDRAMIVGHPQHPHLGFMRDLIDGFHTVI